jgi:two-component system, sensor histidine kinase and response regulator
VDGGDPSLVMLRVHNGGAMPPSLLPNLFDPFRKARQRPEASRGLGLGLFIVKEIARAHGGSVEVCSSVEDGTTFTLRLPRRTSRSRAFDTGSTATDPHPASASP